MTQYPNYPPPYDASLPYMTPQPSRRPTSVTVLAIIGIILGALGTLCGLFGAIFGMLGAALGSGNMMGTPAMPTAINAYNAGASIVNLLFAVVLLVFSIAALSLKPWARRVAIPWAIAMIVWVTIESIIALAWVTPATLAAVRQSQPNNPAMTPQLRGLMSGLAVGGTIFGWILQCLFPVFLLIFWTKPRVKTAFGEAGAVPPPAPPGFPRA